MPITAFKNLSNSPAEIISDDCRSAFFTTIDAPTLEFATVMPFRIRFQTIDIGSYSPANPAPIGIAIIGFNNYIL